MGRRKVYGNTWVRDGVKRDAVQGMLMLAWPMWANVGVGAGPLVSRVPAVIFGALQIEAYDYVFEMGTWVNPAGPVSAEDLDRPTQAPGASGAADVQNSPNTPCIGGACPQAEL